MKGLIKQLRMHILIFHEKQVRYFDNICKTNYLKTRKPRQISDTKQLWTK